MTESGCVNETDYIYLVLVPLWTLATCITRSPCACQAVPVDVQTLGLFTQYRPQTRVCSAV